MHMCIRDYLQHHIYIYIYMLGMGPLCGSSCPLVCWANLRRRWVSSSLARWSWRVTWRLVISLGWPMRWRLCVRRRRLAWLVRPTFPLNSSGCWDWCRSSSNGRCCLYCVIGVTVIWVDDRGACDAPSLAGSASRASLDGRRYGVSGCRGAREARVVDVDHLSVSVRPLAAHTEVCGCQAANGV